MSENFILAGFDRVCINPEESVPLTGYANDAVQFHREILDDIYASCIALTDQNNSTALLITIDACWIQDTVGIPLRKEICNSTGVPEDRIYLCATHTHSAPSQFTDVDPCVERYIRHLIKQVVACVHAALNNRVRAEILAGSVNAKNMNSFKHYVTRDPETGEISFSGDQFGTYKNKEILGHVGQADNTMYLVKFSRTDDKDIILINWRAHPHFTCGYESYLLASSYIGPFVRELESKTGAYAAFFQGACGNVNATTRISAEVTYTNASDRIEQMYDYSRKLSEYALQGLNMLRKIQAGPIRSCQITHPGKVKHTYDHLYPQAKEVVAFWQKEYNPVAAKALAKSYGIRSQYHALDIVYCYEQGETNPIILNAVSIGEELAFVTFPGELFDTISVGTECQSPFEITLCFGYSHHHVGYMHTAVTYSYTSYETDITHFVAGTAEDVMNQYVKMLKGLKETL